MKLIKNSIVASTDMCCVGDGFLLPVLIFQQQFQFSSHDPLRFTPSNVGWPIYDTGATTERSLEKSPCVLDTRTQQISP
jgi:hypothetical protein